MIIFDSLLSINKSIQRTNIFCNAGVLLSIFLNKKIPPTPNSLCVNPKLNHLVKGRSIVCKGVFFISCSVGELFIIVMCAQKVTKPPFDVFKTVVMAKLPELALRPPSRML